MIGQIKIRRQLNEIKSLDELPKSIIICGGKGMGKHTFAQEISSKFGVPFNIIDEKLTADDVSEMYNIYSIRFYLIDFNKIIANKRSEVFQNTLLKFIEEPPAFAWIVILVDDLDYLLETVRNRCQIFKLMPYSINELSQIAEVNDIKLDAETLSLLSTPGNIVSGLTKEYVEGLTNLSLTVMNNIGSSTPSNTLTITNLFMGDNVQYDLDLFLMVFCRTLMQKCFSAEDNTKYFNAFQLTKGLQKDLKIMNVNKKYLLERYLLRLKGELQ